MRELGSEPKLSGLLFSGPQMNMLPLTFAKGNSQLFNFFFFFTFIFYTMRRVVNSAFLCLTKPYLFSDRILRKKLVITLRNGCILNIYLARFFKHRFGNRCKHVQNVECCWLVSQVLSKSKCYLCDKSVNSAENSFKKRDFCKYCISLCLRGKFLEV